MALQVWLPLNGNLNNQGLSNVTFSGTPAWKTAGKIGSCLNLASKLTCNCTTLSGLTEFSIAFWTKVNDDTSLSTNWVDIISFTDATPSGATGLLRWETCYASTLVFRGPSWHNNATYATTNQTIISGVLGIGRKNRWEHLTITVGNDVRVYRQGILECVCPAAGGHLTGAFTIGENNNINGEINDLRIYDHALSPKEVKEISKGLVLHYKLDGNGFGNPNILINTHFDMRYNQTTGWDTTKNGTILASSWHGYNSGVTNASTVYHAHLKLVDDEYVYEYIKTANETWLGISQNGLQNKLIAGEIYTFSWEQYSVSGSNVNDGGLYYYKTGATSPSFHLGHFYGDNSPTGQWKKFSYTFTAPSDGDYSKDMRWYVYGTRGGNGVLYTRHLKLEKGSSATPWSPAPTDKLYTAMGLDNNVVEDSSGYNHNTTLNSSLTLNVDSPRYSAMSMFNGTTYGDIEDTMFTSDHLLSEYTWAAWIYRDYTDATTRFLYNGITTVFLHTNFSTRMSWSHAESSGTAAGNTSDMGQVIPYRQWTHLAWTFKDGYLKIYINGEYKNYSDRTATGQFIKGYRGQALASQVSSSEKWIGGISDMRIYTTALSAEDIKELYNTPVKIDKAGTIYSYELKELNESHNLLINEVITNNGTTSFTYDETTNTYTVTASMYDAVWGRGFLINTSNTAKRLWVPWGKAYRLTMEVWTPTARNFIIDYNNYPEDYSEAGLTGNDHDTTGQRLPNSISIPANTWTRVTFGAINTNTTATTGNPNQKPIYDASNFGFNTKDGALTYKVRNIQWYLVNDDVCTINKNGVLNSGHFNEASIINEASIRKKEKSVEAPQFIEI